MPVINGQKYACESCVRGHRVSNCNHDDRELKFIPPKGRPVKQCEHCRTARKSKSHHAKCDCGNKKEKKAKDKADSPPMVQQDVPSPPHIPSPSPLDGGCCCHEGESCICGSKPEGAEMRQIRRTPQPVRNRPGLTTSHSETKLLVFNNGHHHPNHRHNNIHHSAGAPYPSRKKHSRPQTIHGAPTPKTASTNVQSPNLQYAADDLHLDFSPSKDIFDASSASISEEPWTFDSMSPTDIRGSIDYAALIPTWQEYSPTVTDSAVQNLQVLGTSPNFDYPASHLNFQPSDLPLMSPQATTFSQALTLDDSVYAQVPGLTSNSSARSDNDFWGDSSNSEPALTTYWSDSVSIRNNSNTGLNQWAIDSSSDLTASLTSSGTAVFDETKTSLSMYNDLTTTSSYDLSGQDDVWLGTMGTEPQNLPAESSSYSWPGESGYVS